jgi:hypothetical protein
MNTIFGSREWWASTGKGFLIQLATFILTYATGTLVPALEKEGLLVVSFGVATLVNSIQKAIRLQGGDK